MIFERLFRQKRTRIELNLTDAQIDQLRGVMDNLPLDPYASLVVAVVKQLPLSDVCTPSDADARPAQNISEPGRGFSLIPFTPKGAAGLREIEHVLGTLEVVDERLPHTGDSL